MDETVSNWFTCCAEKDGISRRCGQPALKTSPIPLCRKHVVELLDFYRDELGNHANQRRLVVDSLEAAHDSSEWAQRRQTNMAAQSVVYYARIGDNIKIGYTINLRQRLGALRIYDEDLLATEPGGRELESQRHAQFKRERIDPRREDFRSSPRLIDHIAEVVRDNGVPVITTARGGGKSDRTRSEKRRFRPTVRDA